MNHSSYENLISGHLPKNNTFQFNSTFEAPFLNLIQLKLYEGVLKSITEGNNNEMNSSNFNFWSQVHCLLGLLAQKETSKFYEEMVLSTYSTLSLSILQILDSLCQWSIQFVCTSPICSHEFHPLNQSICPLVTQSLQGLSTWAKRTPIQVFHGKLWFLKLQIWISKILNFSGDTLIKWSRNLTPQ